MVERKTGILVMSGGWVKKLVVAVVSKGKKITNKETVAAMTMPFSELLLRGVGW